MAFGLTAQGFIPMQQQDVITDLNSASQAEFGPNVNLSDQSILGQLIGILSERFALLWQLDEAIYASQYPSGAEGTSVDNILALNNLKRLGAQPTVTEPETSLNQAGITLYGLLLFGVPGTTILAGSIIQTTASPPLSFTLDNNALISATQNCSQSLFLSNAPDMGTFSLDFTDPAGTVMTTATMPFNVLSAITQLNMVGTPAAATSFELVLSLAGHLLTTTPIPCPGAFPLASDIQSAIQALGAPYGAVTVSGSAGTYQITWGSISNPLTAFTLNTTGSTITIIDSIQGVVNNLFDATNNYYPFTDVVVSGFVIGFTFTFGGGTAVGSNPFSGNQQMPLITVATNSLQQGSTVTNTNVVMAVPGVGFVFAGVAYGTFVGSATCTVTGPNFVAANTLTVIGSPVSGWKGVANQLDCVTGSNIESDTQALQRRSTLLASQANGPLQAIIEKVADAKNVPGVSAVVGFQNLNDAALQNLIFASIPVSGHFQLQVGVSFTGFINGAGLTAAILQTAITALPGYSSVLVTGTTQFGYTIDFNGAFGGQSQQLIVVSVNTTGVVITPSFGRPGHSFEIVVAGGADIAIAKTIYASQPAGIKSYGSTTVQILDAFNNPVNISFSRPTAIPIFVTINLITDLFNIPGNPGSGANIKAKFNAQSIPIIQSDITTIGNAVSIGGLIIGFGSDGLIGAFNAVPGIISYTLSFGISPNPTQNINVQMLSEQVPLFEQFNVIVSYS